MATSYFAKEFIRIHGISSLKKGVLEKPSITAYFDHSPESKEALRILTAGYVRFQPELATDYPAPYFENVLYRSFGVKVALSIVKSLGESEAAYTARQAKINADPNAEKWTGAKWMERDRIAAIAYAEAIVEGREFTPLSLEYQRRAETRAYNSWRAVGKAESKYLPYSLLVDADGNKNVAMNMDEINLSSLKGVEDAKQAGRPYSKVDPRYHRQWLGLIEREKTHNIPFYNWLDEEA